MESSNRQKVHKGPSRERDKIRCNMPTSNLGDHIYAAERGLLESQHMGPSFKQQVAQGATAPSNPPESS